MAFTDANQEKTRNHGLVQLKRRVRVPTSWCLLFFTGQGADLVHCRVCVVNALRIAYTTINVEDFTYTFMVEGIMACFELYVGITIACLPTLRPVFSLLLNRESWTFLSKDSAGTAGDDTTGSTQKLHPKSEPQKRNWFDHDDQYLLQDMGNKQKAPQTFTNASGNEPSSQESFAPTHPDGINMRKDVDIYASLASPQPLGHTASPADMA